MAVIGTGATAIQCVPFLGEHAKELLVFQRTPSSVDLRGNSATDETWYKNQEPGWQRERRENFAAVLAGQNICLLYTSPSPRDATLSRMPSSA